MMIHCLFAFASVSAPTIPVALPPPIAMELMADSDQGPVVDDDDDDEADDGLDPEAEQHDAPVAVGDELRYSADLSDEALSALWTTAPEAIGSVSMGFSDSGRIINGVPFPTDGNWLVVNPKHAWATQETTDFVVAALEMVAKRWPDAPALRVNDISDKDGGWLRPHRSHQNGRDVDLGFYYPTVDPVRVRERERVIDVALTWTLLRSLLVTGDVQVILVDRRVQAVLRDHAASEGEDPAWLKLVFDNGAASLVKHARRHRDHFHVRYYNGRAQELGRRLQPLIAETETQHLVTHRVRRGDTLGGIAMRYGVSLTTLRKQNGLRTSAIRAGRRLVIPVRGPCTKCPQPPPVVVPERALPPASIRS
jgi:murein endopeptidase